MDMEVGKGNRISNFFDKFIIILEVTVYVGNILGMVSDISVFQVNFKIMEVKI